MSEINQARRTTAEVFFAGVNITSSIRKYLISLTYTDNEEDETDDLQIKLHDRESIWLTKWLNTAIQAAAETLDSSSPKKSTTSTSQYKVTASSGLAVHSRAGNQYFVYGTLPYGTTITVSSISGGWANFTYSGKNAYVNASYLKPYISTGSQSSGTTTPVDNADKGLRIQATIVRQNWNGDGKDDVLNCGQFELDSVVASGPPATISIKGTSLSYSSTVRQTKKSRSWENYSLSGIASEIASKNGMACMFFSTSNPNFKRIEQYRMSDIAFLQKLCWNYGCSLKVTNNIIVIFDQASYEAKSYVRKIERGKNGGYTKYKLSTNENDKYTSCRVSYVSTSGKVISATAYIDDYDSKSKNNQCLDIKQKVSSIAEARTLAKKLLRLHNKYEFTASFTFPGDPKLLAGCTVMLESWGAWSGKYIIKQAKHNISESGYTTQIELRKALSNSDNDSSKTEAKSSFEVGDKVMCNTGVTTYCNGVRMASWVPSATLYVRQIEKNGAILLVSTEPVAKVYTGRVNASDVHKI